MALPYMFEPEQNSSSEDEELNKFMEECNLYQSIENDDQRIGNTNWCKCNECVQMPTTTESICCKEITQINSKSEEEGVQCITKHPGFNIVCLNPYCLELAYYTYRQQYDSLPSNQRMRYTAYRNLVRWCFGILGKEIRTPLPACAVNKIRLTYPADTVTGFKWADKE